MAGIRGQQMPTEFTYVGPEYPVLGWDCSEPNLSKKQNFDVITSPEKIEYFKQYVMKYSGNSLSSLKVKPFNIYDILEIPPKSCVVFSDHENISTLIRRHYIENREIRPYFHFSLSLVGNKSSGPMNIVFMYDKKLDTAYAPSIDSPHSPSLPGFSLNKIHLLPKDNYLFYVLLKLDKFMGEVVKEKYPNNLLEMKFSTEAFHSRKMDNEPILKSLRGNGGITQNIVIYGSSDPDIMEFILKGVLDLFKGQEDLLGDMDLNRPTDIPAFNIRLNPLIAYAAGDRGQTLDIMLRKKEGLSTRNDKLHPFAIPEWLTERQKSFCSTAQNELNADTRVLLGIDVCKDNKPIDLEGKCAELSKMIPNKIEFENGKYCFLQRPAPLPPTDAERAAHRARNDNKPSQRLFYNSILDPFPLYKEYKQRKAAIKAKALSGSYNNYHPLGGFRRKTTRRIRRKGKKSRRSKYKYGNRSFI